MVKPQHSNEKIVSEEINRFLARRQASQPGFSMRAFARALKLSPSYVNEILKGKKLLPAKHLDKVIRILEIDFVTATEMKRSYSFFSGDESHLEKSKTPKAKSSNWNLAIAAQREMLLNWYFVPMLELTLLPNFDGDFARCLGITKASANYGIKRLRELGLLELREGKWVKTHRHLGFSSSETKEEFRAFHKAMLSRGIKELEKTQDKDYKRRLVTGATLTIDSKRFAELKKKLAEFMREFLLDSTSTDVDEVYSFGLQLIPLTNSDPL